MIQKLWLKNDGSVKHTVLLFGKIWYTIFVATPTLVTGRGCGDEYTCYASRFYRSKCGCLLYLQMARQKQWQLRAYIKTPGSPSRCFCLVWNRYTCYYLHLLYRIQCHLSNILFCWFTLFTCSDVLIANYILEILALPCSLAGVFLLPCL